MKYEQYNIGVIPPQALKVENFLIGELLIDPAAINDVADILSTESFYKSENQAIFSSILFLYKQSKNIDLITVTEHLRKLGKLDEIGGFAYLSQLTIEVASSSHIKEHADIVQDKFIRREYIRVSSETIKAAYDESTDANSLIEFAENNILSVSKLTSVEIHHLKTIAEKRLKVYEEIQKSDKKFSGVPSGFFPIDRVTLGWQKQDLIIFAARPSVGKTQVMLLFAYAAAIQGFKIAIFSLEMSKEQLTDRLIGIHSGINPMKARMGSLSDSDWSTLDGSIQKLIETHILIMDKPGISVTEFRSKTRRLKQEHNIDIVFIDYLQLMEGESRRGMNREQAVSSISRGAKHTAKENDIPVIALSQLNRDSDGRRPMLKDLRESGAIEQDADLVMFIHRETSIDGSRSNKGELIISKHRNGALIDAPFWLDSDAMLKIFHRDPDSVPVNLVPEARDLETNNSDLNEVKVPF